MNSTRVSTRNVVKKIFLAIALLIPVVAFIAGLFAVINHRDTFLQILSFSLAFGSFILAVIATFPRLVNHIWASFRALLYIIVVLIALSATCLFPLVFLVLQDPVIKIGVSLPFGSADRPDAIPMLNAINLAIQDGTQSGKLGNYKIELVAFDDSKMGDQKVQLVSTKTGDLTNTVEDFTSITNDAQIAGIIGPFNSGTATTEIPLTHNASIALISPSNTADCLTTLTQFKNDQFSQCDFVGLDTNKERNFFRMASTDSFRAKMLADYFKSINIGLVKANSAKEAVIFDDKSFFGRSFANRIQEAWRTEMNKSVEIIDLSSNPSQDLQDLKAKPDVIIYSGTGPNGIGLYDAMQRTQYTNTPFAAAATIMRGGLTNASVKNDVYAISPYGNFEQLPLYNSFESEYKNIYYKEPTPYGTSAYASTMILLKSIQEAINQKRPPFAAVDILHKDQFRTEVIHNLKRLNSGGINYEDIMGSHHFDSYGDPLNSKQNKEASIYQHVKGTDNDWNYISYPPE